MRALVAPCLASLIVLAFALPASAQATPGRTAVVMVGGLNSTRDGTWADFGYLEDGLTNPQYGQRYAPSDLYVFSYDPNNADYDPALTCQDIIANVQTLAGAVQWLHDTQGYAHVALVGHSLGGLLSILASTEHPKFFTQGLVRSVTTIDSPLLGVDSGRAFVGGFREASRYGDCPAMLELEQLGAHAPQLSADYAQLAPFHLPILNIANQADLTVSFASQAGFGPAQHWNLNYADGSFTAHAAALKWQKAMLALAGFVGSQGQ